MDEQILAPQVEGNLVVVVLEKAVHNFVAGDGEAHQILGPGGSGMTHSGVRSIVRAVGIENDADLRLHDVQGRQIDFALHH